MCGTQTYVSLRLYSSDNTKEPTGTSEDGKKPPVEAKSTGGGDKGGDKKGSGTQWLCPKCGDPCTHVDTFVCKFAVFL